VMGDRATEGNSGNGLGMGHLKIPLKWDVHSGALFILFCTVHWLVG